MEIGPQPTRKETLEYIEEAVMVASEEGEPCELRWRCSTEAVDDKILLTNVYVDPVGRNFNVEIEDLINDQRFSGGITMSMDKATFSGKATKLEYFGPCLRVAMDNYRGDEMVVFYFFAHKAKTVYPPTTLN